MRARLYFERVEGYPNSDQRRERINEAMEWLDNMGFGYRYIDQLWYDPKGHPYVEFKRLKRSHALMFKLRWGGH